MSSSHKTPQRQGTPQSSVTRQRPSTGRVGSRTTTTAVSSPPTTLSFSPSYDVHGGGGGQSPPSSSQSLSTTARTAPLDLSYPQLHHMKVQRRADHAQRKLGVHRSMLARLQDKVITAPSPSRPQSSLTTTTTTPQSLSKRIPTPTSQCRGSGGTDGIGARRSSTPQQRDIIITSPDNNSNPNPIQHQRRLTPLGTSAFLSTSRRSQGLDASLCYSPTQMAMATPTPKKRPISSHRQAKREAYRDDICHRKQFLNFLSLLQNAPNNSDALVIISDDTSNDDVGMSVLFSESSSLLTVVPIGRSTNNDDDIPPRLEGVLIVSLATTGDIGGGGVSGGGGVRWDTSDCGVFGVGDIESVYTPLESSQKSLPYPVTIVVIQGRLLPQDMVGVASVVSSHPTVQELHLPDTPLDPFLRRTLNDITSSNINIQQVSWKRDTSPSPSSPRSPQSTTNNNNQSTTSVKITASSPSVYIRMSDLTGSPTPSSTDSDTEDDYYGIDDIHRNQQHQHNNNHNNGSSSSIQHSLQLQQQPRRSRRRRSSSGGDGGSVGSSASRSPSLPAAATRSNHYHNDGHGEDDWCLEGVPSECDISTMTPYLGYYPPACESRRQTLMTNPSARPSIIQRRGTASMSLTADERMMNISGVGGRPPRSPISLPLELSGTSAVQTTTTSPITTTAANVALEERTASVISAWQERLVRYLQTSQPALGPSPTKTACRWLHTLLSQLHSNRRAVARRTKRRAREANLSAYIEQLDSMCFHVFSELVVSERMLRTDITELQTAQRTYLYALERQEGKRAHRLDQARRLLEEIEQRMEWVQGREGAFRDALAEEELSLRLSIFVEGMQPSGRSAIIATEMAVRSYAKAFESSSWAHYRGLQRSRQTRQQAEKDVIISVESKGRSLIVREWVAGLRRGKEKERHDAEEVALRPTHSTLVEIALTRPPTST